MKLTFFILTLVALSPTVLSAGTKIAYWDTVRRGANFFNGTERIERFRAAKEFGIEVVRLAPSKWLNGRPEKEAGDFLIGPKGKYRGIVDKDIKCLKAVLDDAEKSGVKIVLTLLSLPGARWKEHNGGVEERALWEDFAVQKTAIEFWKDLARELKDHPALVGYNLRNEPSPELAKEKFTDWYSGDYAKWYAKVKGTPADLNDFYRRAVNAIRDVDPKTPIVLDSGFYATPWAFSILEPVADDKILYSFHMYEPYAFTNFRNKGKFRYPGDAPIGEGDKPETVNWNKRELAKFLAVVSDWQKKHKVPANRIFAGEFGVYRANEGAAQYLADLTEIFNTQKWHWAFYSFREDTWEGMDYELGTTKVDAKYWSAIEKGQFPTYRPNPVADVLKQALKAKN